MALPKLKYSSIIFFIRGLLAVTCSSVESEPDTTVKTLICNGNTYPPGNPFGDSVAYVLATDLMNVMPSQQGYNYYAVSPYPTAVAYGHAICSLKLANSECANCLAMARSTLSTTCGGRIGGQVEMVDCGMRYENYPFT